jgi:hypothetical protein
MSALNTQYQLNYADKIRVDLFAGGLSVELSNICEICGQIRSTRKHRKQQKCSQIRQKMYRRVS